MVLAHDQRPKSSHQLAFVHDELQYESDPSDVEELKQTLEESAIAAGKSYGLRLPIAAEAKSGETWADVH